MTNVGISRFMKYVEWGFIQEVPKSIHSNPERVIEFFTELADPHRVPKTQAHQIVAPSRLLLSAFKKKLLKREHLEAILKHKIQYMQIYMEHVLGGTQPRPVHPGEEPPTKESQNKRKHEYPKLMASVADELCRTAGHSPHKAAPFLAGKSADFWRQGWFFRHLEPTETIHAEEYERALMKDAEFLQESESFRPWFSSKEWSYSVDNGAFLFSGESDILPSVKEKAMLRSFCDEWCLERFGYEVKRNSRVPAIKARRVTVSVSPDNAGTNAFVPRYYRFSHIGHHSDEDFAPLSYVMDHVFEGFRRSPWGVESLVEKKQRARAYRDRLVKGGLKKHLAWLATFTLMDSWSYETMRRHLGGQPKPGGFSSEDGEDLKKHLKDVLGMKETEAKKSVSKANQRAKTAGII